MVSPKFRALMWKHGIVRRRKCCELFFEILAPITPIIAVYLLSDSVYKRYVNQQTGRMMENDYFRSNPKLVTRASSTIADKMYGETMKMVVGYTLFAGPLIVFAFLMSRLLDERASGIRELIKLSGASSSMINLSHFLNAMPGCVTFCIVTTVIVRCGDKPLLPKVYLGLFFCGLLLHFISLLTAAFFFTYISKEAEYSASLVLFVYIALWIPVRLLNFASQSKIILFIIALFPHAPSYWLLEELTAGKDKAWDIYNIWESEAKYKGGAKCGCIGAVFIALAVQITVNAFLAWYLDKIRPGLYGVALPWYFIFPKCCRRIWKKRDKKVYRDDDPNYDRSDYEKFFEPEPVDMYPGIRVESVTKEFCDLDTVYRALTDVSFNVYKGEITVLLGHNGAGKSTIISIITGLMNTTYGRVFINGVNTATKQEEVRAQLGLCPQHNLNFPDLNVIEHFVFFTMLKGNNYDKSFHHSKLLLSKLRLLPRWASKPDELSGGVLRRLQLGCALCGKAGVLILDEPTSGLDLQARREMWDILLSLRGSRTILLTTHFMEEADVLADRIVALHAGRLHCHATPNFLKSAFGNGFRLTIMTIGPPNEAVMTQCIQRSVPNAKLLDLTPNSLVYDLPINKNLTKLFDKIELRKHSMRIQSLAVGISTSLEDVFMNLCRDVDIANMDESIVETPPGDFEINTGIDLFLQRLVALFVRQFNFTTNRCLTFLSLQVLLPILMMFALTQLFNDARRSSNFSFRSQLPDLDVSDVFGVNLLDLMDDRESDPLKLLRTLNISSNILQNDTLMSQYKEIILEFLRNETLFNYFFNDILTNRNITVLNKLRRRRAEDNTKELMSLNDNENVIMRVNDIKINNNRWNEIKKKYSNMKNKIDNHKDSTYVDAEDDVLNNKRDPKVDTKTGHNKINNLNNIKNKITIINSQSLDDHIDHIYLNNTTNDIKENNTSKLNVLDNDTNNPVDIINYQDSINSLNITTIHNTQNIPSQYNNTVDIHVENTQDIINYDTTNLRNTLTTMKALQVLSDNVNNTPEYVVQPSVPQVPLYALNDLNTTVDNVENTQDTVYDPNITDENIKNAQNAVSNSNITNNQVENYLHTLIYQNLTDEILQNTTNVFNSTDDNVRNIQDIVEDLDILNHPNTTENIVKNTLYSLDNLNITCDSIKNTQNSVDESNITDYKVKNSLYALNDLNVTVDNIKDTLEDLNAFNTSLNNVKNILTALHYNNITEDKMENTLNVINKLDFTNSNIKNTLSSLNTMSNINDSVDALSDLKNIDDNVKNTLDDFDSQNISYKNLKYSLDTINNDKLELYDPKNTNKNVQNTLHALKVFNITGNKIKNAIKALNITDKNMKNILDTLNALNVNGNKTINIKNAIRLFDSLNVSNNNISNKAGIADVRESLRRTYEQNMQYNINMFLRSLMREEPDAQKPKSLMNSTMFAIFNIFIIITAALNNTALPTRERITLVRHIHLMTGCSSIMYWSVTFVYHMVFYVIFSVLSAVYAVFNYERDNTLNNGQFYISYIFVLIFGGMAFHMFAYFTTFFFDEHTVSLLLIVLQIIYGLLFPIFTISVSELISLDSYFNYNFYLVELTGAFLPAHTFVTAVLKLTDVARLNRFCEINQNLCPNSIPKPYEVKKFDAKFCCSQGQSTKGRPFNDFSFFYGAGFYFMMLIFQFAFYGVLIIALQDGVFDRWYTRYIKKGLEINPLRFQNDSVNNERSYVDRTYEALMALPNKAPLVDQLLFRHVTVVYPKSIFANYLGLNDVSLSVKKGECLGILGVSGAGKTTIFRAVASEKQHMDGNIYVQKYEKNLHGKNYLRSIGYCPQFDGVDYFRSGYANISTLLKLRGLKYSHLERESWQWLASVGMTKYAFKVVSSYSGGMTRRLVTANSLCAGTPVSILDEPTTGVDTAARRLVWAAMKRGLLNDRAILFTSHGADELEMLSSRILFIGAGEMMVIGTPAALRNEYAPGHTVGLKFNMARAHTSKGQDDIEKVKMTMNKMFDCTLKEEHMTALIYRINRKMTYARTFTVLENIKREFHGLLQEFTVSNTDIEDVFFSFKEQYARRMSSASEDGRSESEPQLPTSDPQNLRNFKDERKTN